MPIDIFNKLFLNVSRKWLSNLINIGIGFEVYNGLDIEEIQTVQSKFVIQE